MARVAGRRGRASTTTLYATDGRDVLHNSPDGWEVEQPWLWWTGPAGSSGGGGPFGNPIPGADPSLQWVAIPAIRRATQIIVDTLVALEWVVRRGTEILPTPDWIGDPQALRMDGRVVDPDSVTGSRLSWMDFWCQWVASAFWFGDGYVWCPILDSFGAPKPPMFVLHPHDVAIENGAYWIDDEEIDPINLLHLRGFEPILAGHGSGLFDTFAATLGYTQTIRDYAAGVFYSGVPAGYLKVNKEGLAQDKADALKARWLAAHGGRTKSIAVLNSTTEFHPLTFTPVDAALIEAMKANLNELANATGVPPDMLGAPTDSNTYANVEMRRQDLATFTYLPWTARIEAVLDARLPRGTSVTVALDGLLRPETGTRYANNAAAIAAGWKTVNEVRAEEGLPPLAEPEVTA